MNFSKTYLAAFILNSATVYASPSRPKIEITPEIMRSLQASQKIRANYEKWVEPYNECIEEGHDKTGQDFEKCLIEKGVDKTNAEIAAFKDISKISPGTVGVIFKMATIEDLRKIFAVMMSMSASAFDKIFANVDKDKVKKFKDLPEDGDYSTLPKKNFEYLKTEGGERDFNEKEFGEILSDLAIKDSNAVALSDMKKKSATENSTKKTIDGSHFSTYKLYYAIGGVLILAAIGGGVYFMKSKSDTEL